MITFDYPKGDLQTIHLMNDGCQIGRLTHSDKVPSALLDLLETDVERRIVSGIENPEEHVYLNFIAISGDYQNKGFFREAVREFESLARQSSLAAITLNAEYGLHEFFESEGYCIVGFLPSVNSYIMKKDLTVNNSLN